MTGIRCDANSIIASGHMMRCLTIAKELVRQGESVTFFLADNESKALFDTYVCNKQAGDLTSDINADAALTAEGNRQKSAEITSVVLGSNWQDMEGELSILSKEIQERKIKRLLVDSYRVTRDYLKAIKNLCPVAYIDDLNEDTYPVDMLINYSGYYKTLGYEESYKESVGYRGIPTALLLGLSYAPLREQFYRPKEENVNIRGNEQGAENKKEESSHASGKANGMQNLSVLLSSGGADTKSMLLSTLLKADRAGLVTDKNSDPVFSKEVQITWHVVVGSLVRDDKKITEFADAHPSVVVHKAVTDMAGLMRKCDIAVCAAGTMLTECAAIGLPAIFYQVADNQKYNVEFWGRTGGMVFAGDATDDGSDVTGNICSQIKTLLQENALSEMRENLSGITDGRGAQRIAKALLEL